jgi:hypothetical protein
MGAITGAITRKATALIAAIRAGIDLLIVANYPRETPNFPKRLIRAIGIAAMDDPTAARPHRGIRRRIETLKRDAAPRTRASPAS